MANEPSRDSQDKQGVPVGRLAISWLIVGIPLLWGIYQTFIRSLALFE